jgi:two-component system response regulator
MAGQPMILVVQGNPDDANLLSLAFDETTRSTKVHFVPDGKEAINYLRGTQPYENRVQVPLPSLLLVDLRLHGMSAFELLDWVRLDPSLNRIGLAVLVELEHDPDIQKAHVLGADFHIIKPGSFRELVTMAQRLSDCAAIFVEKSLRA